MYSYWNRITLSLSLSLSLSLRQEAIPLVDAFDIPDDVLNSALGRYDGDVYKHLYEWALKAPRNKTEVLNVSHRKTAEKTIFLSTVH